MRHIVLVIALSLTASACGKSHSKTCSPQPAESFVGKVVPDPALATALTDLAAHNKVCGKPGNTHLVISGSRPSAVEAIEAAMKPTGFLEIPGRTRTEGSFVILSFAKTKDATTGDLVELSVGAGVDCDSGDVCVENLGYTVVPR